MDAARPSASPRLPFLDNVRYLMVLVVVGFHVSAGYSGLEEFFYENDSGGLALYIRHFLGGIPSMHLLFFVAGYFALPSLRDRSYAQFLGRKFTRLGIPFLFCILFLGPLMPYMGYYSQSFNGLATDSYWEFWKNFIGSGLDSWMTRGAFVTNPGFHQMHYWFISLLVEFFILFALIHAAWKKWGKPIGQPTGEGRNRSLATQLLIAVLLMALWRGIGELIDPPRGIFAFLFHDFFTGPFDYGAFFALGIYAQARGWFTGDRIPDLRTFGILTGLMVLTAGIGFALFQIGGDDLPRFVGDIFGSLGQPLFVLWFMVIATGLTYRYMNGPSAINAKLAANSYDIYLIHYPIIVALRLILLPWEAPTMLKWSIVLTLALLLSYLISEYLIRRSPRLALSGLVGLHLILCLFGLPRSSYSHQLLDHRERLTTVIPAGAVPERVDQAPPEQRDGRSRATPKAALSWQDGTLYFAKSTGGLHAIDPDGAQIKLDPGLKLGAIAPLPDGHLAAVESATGRILELDPSGKQTGVLVDSTAVGGTPLHLAVDTSGGLYFTTESQREESGQLLYRAPDGRVITALADSSLRHPTGIALSADGSILFLDDAGSPCIWAFAVAPDGILTDGRPFAELFLANARYGRAELGAVEHRAEGMVADRQGRLYVATRFGLQIFDPAGELLDIVHFPVPISWNPKRPLNCAFGGADRSTLYVACGDEIYAVPTLMRGI